MRRRFGSIALRAALGVAGLVLLVGLGSALSAGADEPVRIYEVKRGEALWTIAAVAIGDATLLPALYRANRDQIKNPSLVYPGQRLTIPTIDPSERDALRRQAAHLVAE